MGSLSSDGDGGNVSKRIFVLQSHLRGVCSGVVEEFVNFFPAIFLDDGLALIYVSFCGFTGIFSNSDIFFNVTFFRIFASKVFGLV